ncbi:MAG: N-acetyl-gamma-glutamyl-phosphate reductase [Cellulosilyticaceae bacterium]
MKKVAIIGATGYVGGELTRLLYNHKEVSVPYLSSHRYSGEKYSTTYPNFYTLVDTICGEDDLLSMEADVIFIALPHGMASQMITPKLLEQSKVIDLGADFRISKVAYEKWYQTKHFGEALLQEAVYGLCEWNRERIKSAKLVANPGCYVTCTLLTLLPLIREGIIDKKDIIIDAKSGVTGAGRGLNLSTHFTECNETTKAYAITTHRHIPEIEEQLEKLGNQESHIIFTPHLMPMNRGILTTIYANIAKNVTLEDVTKIYKKYYETEQFIRILEKGNFAETRWVKGSNYCDISFEIDKMSGKIILVSAIDNLIKGAAGQAVQNMNIMMGWEENLGINMPPIFPA